MKRKKGKPMTVATAKKLDMAKVQQRMKNTISTKEALKEVLPFQWEKDIIEGKKKIIIDRTKK